MTVRLLIYLGYYALSMCVLKDPLAFILTMPMIALVIFNVSKIRDPFITMEDMLHFLMYLFFVIEPIQMIDHGHIGQSGPVSAATYTNEQLSMGMLIAFLFYAILTVALHLFRRSQPRLRAFVIGKRWSVLILVQVILAFAIYTWLTGGIAAVLSSRYDRLLARDSQTSDSLAALGAISISVLTMGVILLASQIRLRVNVTLLCFLVAVVLLLICYNPFNAARFGLLGAYVPLALVLMNGKVRSTLFYAVAMFGIVVLFPILNISTRFGLAGFSEHNENILADAFSLQFVDTYDLLVECVRYVDVHGLDHGQRLLADILVYFPRTWWPGKPVLGGLDIGNELLSQHIFGTANVSQIVAADGYMDFGLPGVILVGGIVAALLHHLVFKRRYFVNGHDLFGYAFIAALPILVRGPLAAVITLILFQTLTLAACRYFLGREIQVPRGIRVAGLGVRTVEPEREGPSIRGTDLATPALQARRGPPRAV